jgi:hypothetical protein
LSVSKSIFARLTSTTKNLRKLLLLFFCSSSFTFSQVPAHNQDDYFIKAYKSDEVHDIDGLANEDVWKRAVQIGEFWEKFPTSDKKSATKTTVKAAYNDTFVYFIIECYDSTNTYIAPSLKRDASLVENDGLVVVLDPVNKRTNGFGFACTPNNVQSEYQFGTGSEELNFAWDNKWFSAVKRLDDRYVMEMAIPFKTLRYNAENTKWGINFLRSDRKKNEFSSWTNIPVQFNGIDLGYLGLLQFEGDIVKQKNNISIIPYVTGSTTSDLENGEPTTYKANAGFDAKVAVTASLNLDLTFNPDFSQVEVDEQVTNLTRFSIFFPERRTFFLENSDIFSEFAAPPFRPFFSRSLGLDKDANPIPILYGARLSGNIGEKTRVGVMNMQTLRKGEFSGQNYTAASVHQRFGSRSVIKGYFLNREATDLEDQEKVNPLDKFGRNAGVELRLIDKSGSNQAWLGYHNSMKEGVRTDNDFYEIGGGHFGQFYEGFIDFSNFGGNYYADMGFVNRLETFAQIGDSYDDADTTIRAGFKQMYNENLITFRPKDKKVIQLAFGFSNYMVWFQNGGLSDRAHKFSSELRFRNASSVEVKYNIQEDNLKYYFPLPENKPLAPGNYSYNNLELNYMGDARKNFIVNGGILFGQFFNARIRQYNLSVLLRKQPYFSTTLSAQFNDLLFPDDYGRTKLWLLGPKIEATFTDKLFWTTFLQFNTQRNNFNINSRVQYRYSPMSDFFLVYSDNYFTDSFQNKNRAIIFKFNYWFSL